jgi:LysM repeat protein
MQCKVYDPSFYGTISKIARVFMVGENPLNPWCGDTGDDKLAGDMTEKFTPQNVIDGYQKRQRTMPFLIGGLAVLLVAIGIIVLIIWFSGDGGLKISLFASKTPTPTVTYTPTPVTPTSTPTLTPTETLTPTITETPTPSGPFEYEVKENDNCWEIAQTFEVDINVLLAINNFGGSCPISPGDKILIPAPNTTLPTETPIPSDLPRGTKINYIVKVGDNIEGIAAKFSSTVDAIIKENKITDANQLFAGQELIIPVNIATATPTIAPTSTKLPASATPAGPAPTPTRAATLGAATLPPRVSPTP